mgnify:CR=1 FL=1
MITSIDAEDVSIEADYSMIHFSLQYPELTDGKRIYVYGNYNNYALEDSNEMYYNTTNNKCNNTQTTNQTQNITQDPVPSEFLEAVLFSYLRDVDPDFNLGSGPFTETVYIDVEIVEIAYKK